MGIRRYVCLSIVVLAGHLAIEPTCRREENELSLLNLDPMKCPILSTPTESYERFQYFSHSMTRSKEPWQDGERET
jgi:hypothetical protein